MFRQDFSGYVPSDFPVGPWLSHEDAKDDIQKFCKDINTGGGAWSIRWNGTPKPDAVRRLVCSNAHDQNLSRGTGSKPRQQNGTKCQWRVKLSARQTDGIHDWVVSGGFWKHNHDLLSSRSGLASSSRLRAGIPPELMLLGQQLHAAGMRAGVINAVLRANASVSNAPITWNYNDVQIAFMPNTADR